jgi:cytochrome c553
MLAMALAMLPLGAAAQETAARSLAASCAACHGSEGRSVSKEVIALAGLPKEHIVSQMKAFKDGTRPATVMHQLAKGYTDQQIDAIAGYFAAQKK